MIFTKGSHHGAKFETFDCSGEISPNLYFDRLLLLKVYKVSAKKSVEELCLMIPKSYSVHPPPYFCRRVEPPIKFSKRAALAGPQLLEGVAGKEGDNFFQGAGSCNFHIKNKLKSEIFNDKKSL